MFDAKLKSLIEANINLTVPWYLTASWAYYVEDAPILSDAVYDALCVKMRERWMWITHWHKPIIVYADLVAGACLLSQKAYPTRVVGALQQLRGG